jgi:hypothetical protein
VPPPICRAGTVSAFCDFEPVRPAPFTTTVVEIYPDREPSEDLVTVSK